MLKTVMNIKAFRIVAVAAAAAFIAIVAIRPAQAASSTTGTFNVTASVVASCNLAAITDLAFGNYDPVNNTGTTGTTTLGVTCTSGTTYTIALNYGSNSGSKTDRFMSDGSSHTIGYNLYTDSAHTNVWYDNSTDPCTASNCVDNATGTGSSQSYTVYGQIDATQATQPPVGSYSDTITVTVSY